MTTIRIISDPYKRNISFEMFDNYTNEYQAVDIKNNPGSKLLKEDIRGAFFPYKIKEIIEIIKTEYAAYDEIIGIEFQGTDDEFDELYEACLGDDEIVIKRAEVKLENARDILPRIIGIYNKIQPIIQANFNDDENRKEIERDIRKFTESSNDVVPICVLGNYSSGKSSFINALIGQEILPSGDMPVTAKVYRIQDIDLANAAEIDFEYLEEHIHIDINEEGCSVSGNGDIVYGLRAALEGAGSDLFASKVAVCLAEINEHAGVSDLIDIKVSFADSQLKGSNQSFVIFDTPGSNTATHRKHFEILENAMKNLSNGVPLYIAEYDSLDSCDNESLYHTIRDINQIDERFTMIVVNKADTARLKKGSVKEEQILGQAVPRNLYSGGIFFVSSIMGLGSKTEGAFLDEFAEEIYDDQERKYKDPESKNYKTLYEFNIMPEQIKKNIVSLSTQEENRVYANSGLYAIEHEIVNFAEKYSAYDKCKQSDRYLDNAIDKTRENLESLRGEREAHRGELENELEEDKKKLMQDVETHNEESNTAFGNHYEEQIRLAHSEEKFTYTSDQVRNIEKGIRETNRVEYHIEDKLGDVTDSFKGIVENVRNRSGKEAVDGLKNAFGAIAELNESRKAVNKETNDELIEKMSEDLKVRLDFSEKEIDNRSKVLCEEQTVRVKEELSGIVSESETLDESKKKELNDIIMSYRDLSFNDIPPFEKDEFELTIRILNWEIDLNILDKSRLTKEYNRILAEALDKRRRVIQKSHMISFEKWNENLVSQILNNIVGYSPKLSEKARLIDEETEKIHALADTIDLLINYKDQIDELMNWKY